MEDKRLKIEEHKPAELSRLLEKFYAEVKNKNVQPWSRDCPQPIETEDITCLRVDMNFIVKCSTRYLTSQGAHNLAE